MIKIQVFQTPELALFLNTSMIVEEYLLAGLGDDRVTEEEGVDIYNDYVKNSRIKDASK